MSNQQNNDFQKIPKEEFISDWSEGYQVGLIKGREQMKDKYEQAITDAIVKGGMENGDCYISLDLLNEYLKII